MHTFIFSRWKTRAIMETMRRDCSSCHRWLPSRRAEWRASCARSQCWSLTDIHWWTAPSFSAPNAIPTDVSRLVGTWLSIACPDHRKRKPVWQHSDLIVIFIWKRFHDSSLIKVNSLKTKMRFFVANGRFDDKGLWMLSLFALLRLPPSLCVCDHYSTGSMSGTLKNTISVTQSPRRRYALDSSSFMRTNCLCLHHLAIITYCLYNMARQCRTVGIKINCDHIHHYMESPHFSKPNYMV